MKRFIILCLILAVPWYTEAQSAVTITAPAVERTPDGLNGVLSSITVVAQKGSGHIYIDTWPLAEVDIQGSARLAVQVACEVVQKDWNDYDFFITVRSDSPIIGGPSAGGAMTVAVIAAVQGWDLTGDVVMSGTINPDETVGPVGGLYQKAQAASQVAHMFLVPEGQSTILVEEKNITQKGPFTYIQTVQKEVDLVEEGRKMGVDVKEVYDIRDAVFYFTGKRIEAPSITAEPIKADFAKSYAEQELERIQKEYTSAVDEVQSFTGSYKKDLEHILGLAQEQIEYAHTTYDSGDYYTCMSACFVAGLYTTYAVNLLYHFEGYSVEEIFSGLNTQLEQVSTEINQEPLLGMTALQCIAAAQKRIFEAQTYYREATEQRSVFTYIEYASYAQQRKESATFWLDLSREYQKGDEITQPVLKDTASSMINTAELSLVYGSSVLSQNDLLQEAQTRLETAQTEFVGGMYSASLFSAIESKVHSEVALLTSSSKRENIAQRVERARERATNAIEVSRKQGIEPVLAVSYYELAESMDSPVQSLIYLRYAEEVASIHTYIQSQSEPFVIKTESGSIDESETGPEPLKSSESDKAQHKGTDIVYLVVGVCFGIGLSWLVARLGRSPAQ
jgi:uncharacterized protein